MASTKSDPIAEALDLAVSTHLGTQGKVNLLYGDRPQVLESIVRARKERKLSYSQIAKVLSSAGPSISAAAIKTWLDQKGVQ